MAINTCCLLGSNSEWAFAEGIEEVTEKVIVELIEKSSVGIFFVSRRNEFERIAEASLRRVLPKYPDVKLILVMPYDRVDIENELRECEHLYHDVLLLGTKRISGIRRPINLAEEIVDLSGYMLTYILKQNEEASAAFSRSKKQGVVIHNCAELLNISYTDSEL